MKELVNDKKPYEAPQLTVVSFKTERGYAASNLLTMVAISTLINAEQSSAVSRSDYGTAVDDNWNW